jgi:hypothetical protein
MSDAGIRYALARLLFEVDCEPVPGMERRFTYRLSREGEQRVAMLEWRRKTNS